MSQIIYIILLCIGLLIISIILTRLYYVNIIDKIIDNIEYFTFNNNIDGPTILILGATHGNEQSGYYIIKKNNRKFHKK